MYYEQQGHYNKERVYEQTERIYEILTEVINLSESQNTTTHHAAKQLAIKRIEDMGTIKLPF